MYAAYFHLRARPFSATPDASCFYASEAIQESIDELVLRSQTGHGIAILTGMEGTGKTLLCQRLIAELGGSWSGISLSSANLSSRKALLQAILFELGQSYQGMDEQELRLALLGWLRSNAKQARRAILILDEAHLLPERLMEEVRGLADLSEGGKPLLQVVLCGDVTLDERLTSPGLNAFNQRVGCHVVLEPLDQQQTLNYIDHRVGWSGGDASQMFAPDALCLIARLANGIPRCINYLCDHCLLLAYVNEVEQVTRSIVLDAITDLRRLPLPWSEPFQAGDVTGPVVDHAESIDATRESAEAGIEVFPPGIEAQQFSGHVTSIEIGGTLNEERSCGGTGSPHAETSTVNEHFDEQCECEDNEFVEQETSIDEDVPCQPAVGFGVVPLVDLRVGRAVEPSGRDDGIAFTISRPTKSRTGRESVAPPAPALPEAVLTKPDRQSNASQFVEERILDRYAALEAGWPVSPEYSIPVPPPTDVGFSDPLDRWNNPSPWSPGIVPLLPESPRAVEAGHLPDVPKDWDDIARETASDRDAESVRIDESVLDVSAPPSDSEATATCDDASADYEDIEDQIGNAVLDLCFETQQAILNRFNEREIDGQWAGNGSDGSAFEAAFGGDSDSDSYDVVQPEAVPAEGVSDLETRPGERDKPQDSSERRPVGRPADAGLKRLFSTLRKRQK
jgi:type II secretory pathway predicted ATPase ExeA